MKTITYEQLKDKKACSDQLKLFKNTFGDSVEVTVDMAVSVADKFDFTWAADNLLSSSALAEYDRVATSACDERGKEVASSWDKYEKKECEEETTSSWDKYEKVRAPSLFKYEKVCAKIFAELYLKDK